ncbi:hypothetical protein BO221_46895 [Archangium sp. Cb G35]|nr:hypothetical protein BO221_46895 [Archangium sp. Cb G35]
MLLNDTFDDGKTQAHSTGPLGVEGLEDAGQVPGNETGSLIHHRAFHPGAPLVHEPPRGEPHGGAARRVLERVGEQVLEHLDEPARIHGDAGQPRLHAQGHMHLALMGEGAGEAHGLLEHAGERAGMELRARRAAVREQLVHQVVETGHLAAQRGDEGRMLPRVPEARLEGIQGGGDAEEGVAHLVGHPGHQRAHVGQQLVTTQRVPGLAQLELGFPAGGEIAREAGEAPQPAIRFAQRGDDDEGVEARAIPAHPPALVSHPAVRFRLGQQPLRQARGDLLLEEEHRQVLPDDLPGAIARDALGPRVPAHHAAIGPEDADAGILHALHQEAEALVVARLGGGARWAGRSAVRHVG